MHNRFSLTPQTTRNDTRKIASTLRINPTKEDPKFRNNSSTEFKKLQHLQERSNGTVNLAEIYALHNLKASKPQNFWGIILRISGVGGRISQFVKNREDSMKAEEDYSGEA